MCNLSDGIEERGIIKGRTEGRTELLKQQVQKKLLKGKDIDVIAEELEEEVAVIEKVIAELEQQLYKIAKAKENQQKDSVWKLYINSDFIRKDAEFLCIQ